MTLVEFLRHRLDEDAAPVAHDAWHEDFCLSPEVPPGWDQCFYCGAKPDSARVELVPRPKRVLAEVDAKRRLIELAFEHAATIDGEFGCCHDADEIERGECRSEHPDDQSLLHLLALPYADHPDYDEEWRP